MPLPSKQQQIAQTHAELIITVVKACANPAIRPSLAEPLRVSRENGWSQLVDAIERILDGYRGEDILKALDEEDQAIIAAILLGIHDPSTLPDPNAQADGTSAAPGLAQLIHAAGSGNTQALTVASEMAEQMSKAGGDMAHIAGIMRKLINGDRDGDALTQGMGKQGQDLVQSILDELARLNAQ